MWYKIERRSIEEEENINETLTLAGTDIYFKGPRAENVFLDHKISRYYNY